MSKYSIGIDLGGTTVKLGLVKEDAIVATIAIPAHAKSGLASSLPFVEDAIEKLLLEKNLKIKQVNGIAIGFPGLVNNITKRIISTNKKYDDAVDVDLEKWAHDKWNVPLVLENDARAAAVGEWKFGAGKGYDNIVMITIGTGIGSAAIMEGRLLRGKHFQAGCLGGHISVQYDGRQCTCGNIGCAEAYGSTWSLQEIAKASEHFENSKLKQLPRIDFKALFTLAEEEDSLAISILDDCMKVWSAAIVNLVHAYDPEAVILGGGVLESADKILPYLTRTVHQHAWCPWGKVHLRASSLLNDAGILGAAYLLSSPL